MTDFPEVPASVPTDKKGEWEKAVFDAKLKRVEASYAAENAIDAEFFKSVFAVAQGSIDRARAGADTVQKAAAAIAALYTPLLGVVFSVSDNPLPSRGVIPVLFLGLAILSSTAYLAYQTRAAAVGVLEPKGSTFERNIERARSFIEWTRKAADHRSYLLKVGVVALAVGIAFLPAPFVSFQIGSDTKDEESAAATAITIPTEPVWPEVGTEAGDEPLLQRVLYRAKVAEVAKLRDEVATAAEPFDTGVDDWWWWAAAVGFGVTLLAPFGIDALFGKPQTENEVPAKSS
jgi:hypothetical protein